MGNSSARRATADAMATIAVFFPGGILLAADASAFTGSRYLALATGAAITIALAAFVLRRTPRFSTPADRITLFRAVLVGCCATIIVPTLGTALEPGWLLIVIGTVAFVLDALDGRVARHFGCASEDGARLDMEVDAALLLVLCWAAVGALGWWTLAIGLMRYAFVAASWIRPALKAPLQPSMVRKFIGAAQAFALLVALAPGMPVAIGATVVTLALLLLTVSFARDVSVMEWSYHQHPDGAANHLLTP